MRQNRCGACLSTQDRNTKFRSDPEPGQQSQVLLSLGYSVQPGHGIGKVIVLQAVPAVITADILGSQRPETPLTCSPFHLQIIKEVPPPPVEESEVSAQSRVHLGGKVAEGSSTG